MSRGLEIKYLVPRFCIEAELAGIHKSFAFTGLFLSLGRKSATFRSRLCFLFILQRGLIVLCTGCKVFYYETEKKCLPENNAKQKVTKR